MTKRTLMITMTSDWRAALRAAGKRATSRSYQGEVLNFESAGGFASLGLGTRSCCRVFDPGLDGLKLDDGLTQLFARLELGDDKGTEPKDGEHHDNGPELAEDPRKEGPDGSHGLGLVDSDLGIRALLETIAGANTTAMRSAI